MLTDSSFFCPQSSVRSPPIRNRPLTIKNQQALRLAGRQEVAPEEHHLAEDLQREVSFYFESDCNRANQLMKAVPRHSEFWSNPICIFFYPSNALTNAFGFLRTLPRTTMPSTHFPPLLNPPTHTLAARARARYPSHRLLRTTYSWKDAPVGEARHPEARHPEARRSAGLPGEVPLEDGVG
jgi:hypothetical protein